MIIMPDADMDQAVDVLIGAGYGSAGERCMAISVAVPVGEATAETLMRKLVPSVEALKIGPSTDLSADYGPLITKQAVAKVRDYVDVGLREGATPAVDGRGFTLQGYTRDGDAARDSASKVQVGMIGINVPVPLAYHTFGGWKRSGFGDLNQHGPDAVRFYTKTKTVTSRWPSGIKDGAEFAIPTMQSVSS